MRGERDYLQRTNRRVEESERTDTKGREQHGTKNVASQTAAEKKKRSGKMNPILRARENTSTKLSCKATDKKRKTYEETG